MWARDLEIALACWLALSPFVFRHDPQSWTLFANDFACAAWIVTFALLSYVHRLRKAHLLQLVAAFWLVGWGWAQTRAHGEMPASQNHIVVGMLLAMLAIIPSRASLPPERWRRFYGEDGSS